MNTRRFLTVLFLIVGTVAYAQEGADQPVGVCPLPEIRSFSEVLEAVSNLNDHVTIENHVTALVGVDALGRVAIAIDNDQDELVDTYMLYTDRTRLEGPWSRELRDAKVMSSNGAVLITSKSQKFALSVAVSFAKSFQIPDWVNESFTSEEGRELVKSNADEPGSLLAAGPPLAGIDHNVVHTWPESYWYDLLDPGTNILCLDGSCTAGGAGSSSCSIGGCIGSPSSCSVGGCNTGGSPLPEFACCKCKGFFNDADCRCLSCVWGGMM